MDLWGNVSNMAGFETNRPHQTHVSLARSAPQAAVGRSGEG